MRIAVTGASGRVGRAVMDAAKAAGHDVVGLDRRGGNDVTALDLTDYDEVVRSLTRCDALIHLAAIAGPGRHDDHVVHDNNVVCSYHALRAAAEVGIGRICQASSINAIGGRFSRRAEYDFFPVDESHPTRAEDPYSLSKWLCEQQADAIARRHDGVSIASLRLHGVVTSRNDAMQWTEQIPDGVVRQLWGYTTRDAAARAFLAGVTTDLAGHERFFVVAPDTMTDTPSHELAERHYPHVEIRGDLSGHRAFFDSRKATTMLGWQHDPTDHTEVPDP